VNLPGNPRQPHGSRPPLRNITPRGQRRRVISGGALPSPCPRCFQRPLQNPQQGTSLRFAPLTHRSPVSRMLLRYLWQSWRTWGQKQEGCGVAGLAPSWPNAHVPAPKLGKVTDLAPYATTALGEEHQAFQWQPEVGALHKDILKTQDRIIET